MKRAAGILAALIVLAVLGSLASDSASAADAPKDRVVVMYFHRTQRCPTCLRMGSYAEEAVAKGFAKELQQGKVSFHYLDFQDERNAAFTRAYGVGGPALVVARASDGKVAEYKDLREMWTKVRDKDAFLEYVQSNVKSYLK